MKTKKDRNKDKKKETKNY